MKQEMSQCNSDL